MDISTKKVNFTRRMTLAGMNIFSYLVTVISSFMKALYADRNRRPTFFG